MSTSTSNNPRNLVGMIGLMDAPQEINLEEIERNILQDTKFDVNNTDLLGEYEKELQKLTQNFALNTPGSDAPSAPPLDATETRDVFRGDDQLRRMTLEEENQRHVANVMKDFDSGHISTSKYDDERVGLGPGAPARFDIEKESEDDDKLLLLEQIDTLREILVDDRVNLENIPHVNKSNTLAEIKDVYHVLCRKNDRNRDYCFANEMILAGAKALESLFDGQREWFSRKPDLRGWSDTVKSKLRRMRYETSTLVRDVMEGVGIGPRWRILFELIPSMFLHTRDGSADGTGGVSSNMDIKDERYTEAINKLNDFSS